MWKTLIHRLTSKKSVRSEFTTPMFTFRMTVTWTIVVATFITLHVVCTRCLIAHGKIFKINLLFFATHSDSAFLKMNNKIDLQCFASTLHWSNENAVYSDALYFDYDIHSFRVCVILYLFTFWSREIEDAINRRRLPDAKQPCESGARNVRCFELCTFKIA